MQNILNNQLIHLQLERFAHWKHENTTVGQGPEGDVTYSFLKKFQMYDNLN